MTFCDMRLCAKKLFERFTANCYLVTLQVFTLGLLQLHIAFVAAKAVVDQQAEESQVSSSQVAQQRIGHHYGELPLISDHDHHYHHDHHHHEEHDAGFWKKKVEWKEGWKKYWKAGKKQIWKPDWKKIWKPIWVPVQLPVWKDIQVSLATNIFKKKIFYRW